MGTKGTGIQRVAGVGGGQMRGGVAELTAKAGLPTVVKEISPEAAERSRAGIQKSLDRGLERGKLDEAAHAAALGNLTFTTDFADLADCDLVAETLFAEYGDDFYLPPPLLRRMVAAGHLGRKTGRGFYDYS